jgi:hypothetical protein
MAYVSVGVGVGPYADGVLFIGRSSRMLLSNKGVGICSNFSRSVESQILG